MLNTQTLQYDIGPWDENPPMQTFNLKYIQNNNKKQVFANHFSSSKNPLFKSKYNSSRRNLSSDRLDHLNKELQKATIYKTLDGVSKVHQSEERVLTKSRLQKKRQKYKLFYGLKEKELELKEEESRKGSFQLKKNNRLSFLHRRREEEDEEEQIFVNIYSFQSPKNKTKMKLPKIQLSVFQ